MRRRDFIALIGSAAASWPLPARAQQRKRVRRISALNGTAPTGPNPASHAAFLRRLGEPGWTDGRNGRIEIRRANSDLELMRSYGTEPAGRSPDVFLVHSNPASRLRPWNGRRPLAKTIPGQISGINRREQQGEGHDQKASQEGQISCQGR